jgi:hypothetical protein
MELKPMKLIFLNNVDTWDKIITDLRGNIILEQKGLKFFPEMNNKEYFDDWENQMKNNPNFNIVEVERFI